MNEDIHIAIIDDGVNEKYFDSISLENNLVVTREMKIENRTNYNPYIISHGTICAGIIKKYYNNALITSLKVLKDNGFGNISQLVKAIEWCIENKIKVINLSLGTNNSKDISILKSIIDKAYLEGIIIVAANQNDNIITYPAFFHNVIGVKCDRENILNSSSYIYNCQAIDGIEITACSNHILVNYNNIPYNTANTNSFAAPMITGLVADIINKNPSKNFVEIKQSLFHNSIYKYNNSSFIALMNDLSWIKSAFIFTMYNDHILIEKYIFAVRDIIYINDVNEIIKTVRTYLKENSGRITEHDTLIIEYRGVDETELHLIIRNASTDLKLKNNKVMLLNKEKSKGLVLDSNTYYLSKINVAMDSPVREININEEIPIIAVIGDTKEELIITIDRLYQLFSENNYNLLIFNNSIDSLYYGYHYSPYSQTELTTHSAAIQNKLGLYNADIGIYIFDNNSEITMDVIKIYKESIFDIIIIYENSAIFNNYKDYILKNKDKFIIITENYNEQKKSYSVNSLDINYAKTIFGDILGRYCIE